VPDTIVERTIEHLSPTVAAMVRLQLASAMRPGELVIMTARDLDMSGPIWEYRPGSWKTEHHASRTPRVIMLGPKAQEAIRPFLRLDLAGFLFSPKRAFEEQNEERRTERKTPLYDAHIRHQAKRRKARGRRPFGDHYDVNAYRIAIARACDKAFPHPTLSKVRPMFLTEGERIELKEWQKSHRWHPHQLRHSAATIIRKQFGVEAAQAVLGHAEIGTTEIYAERSLDAARQIMKEIG
jgi:integrase